MKKYVFLTLALPAFFVACNSSQQTKADSTAAAIQLPYEAGYATDFTNDVSDSDLLAVLDSYKYWETGDMSALRSTLADSIEVEGANGFKYKGPADSLIKIWALQRDSLSSVSITMDVWLKNHSVKDSANYINVWYKEIDTYKTGKVDSAYYEDDNGMKNGKVAWFSSHKQVLK
jgi:hypothetical protein